MKPNQQATAPPRQCTDPPHPCSAQAIRTANGPTESLDMRAIRTTPNDLVGGFGFHTSQTGRLGGGTAPSRPRDVPSKITVASSSSSFTIPIGPFASCPGNRTDQKEHFCFSKLAHSDCSFWSVQETSHVSVFKHAFNITDDDGIPTSTDPHPTARRAKLKPLQRFEPCGPPASIASPPGGGNPASS